MSNVFNPGLVPHGGARVSGACGFCVAMPIGRTYRNAVPLSTLNYAYNGAPRIDVGAWEVEFQPENEDTTTSGSFGFRSETRVSIGATFRLQLPEDFLAVAELKLQNGSGVQMYFKLGDKTLFYPDAVSAQKFLYCPRCLLARGVTTNDVTKAVKYNAQGSCHAIFHLPEEMNALTAYLAYNAARGWDG